MSRHRRIVPAAVVFAAAITSTLAQSIDRPTLYRLDPTSLVQSGCFAPCMCPVLESDPVTGTFRLIPTSSTGTFAQYDVRGVRWTYRRPTGETVPVTGSGTYAVDVAANLQRMSLTLVVGTDAPVLYQSGEVQGGAAFPRIAIAISINGGYCHDTVFTVHAKPAQRFYVDPDAFHWDADPDTPAARSDVVYGDLETLRETGAAFSVATWGCATDANASTSASFPNAPDPNTGFWFLQRTGGQLYADGDAAEVGAADSGIAASPSRCP